MDKNIKKKGANIPAPILILIGILAILAFIHTLQSRATIDFVRYSLYIIAAVSIIFLIIFIILAIQTGISKPTKADFIMSIGGLIALLLIGPLYYSVGVSLKDLYLWIQSPNLSKNGAMIITVIITLILGLALFYFRLRARSLYGFTEAAIGLTVAANKVAAENSQSIITSNFYLAILTASVYLVVRGLDNIHQGLTKEPIDPYGLKLVLFLKLKK